MNRPVALICFLIAIFGSKYAFGQTEAPEQISIHTDSQSFKKGAEVKLHVSVKNTSDHPIDVSSGTGLANGGGDAEVDNAIFVRDASGNVLPRVDEQVITRPDGKGIMPLGFHSRRGFTLQPGEMFRDFAVLSRLFDFSRPGVCTVTVAQEFPLDETSPHAGIAPFRAFLHERRALGAKGRNWLFFGERSAKTDFLYREELAAMRAEGHLTRLDTAFSRDQADKVYVQDKMMEQAPQFWSWLQDGASVFVCGDASRMAKDVHAALHSIVEKQGDMSSHSADEYVQSMREDHRYHRDVY